ncbi:MAG: ABC transporter ATP-binding protein [Deltaproteobacteria bacterium]|nr:ABC transporter ATP-binding protein [Deltaproteobacteria bacterium]
MTASSLTITDVALREVTKLYGPRRALFNISLEAHSGDVIGIIGQNGAGKSTLLSILSMLMKPTAGVLELNGHPAQPHLRARFGILSHQPLVYPELTCDENLSIYASLCGVDASVVERLRERLDLSDFFSDRPAGVLSRGQLQRLALARALVATPDVLLLDEPSSGLDRQSTFLIEQIVDEHRDIGGIAFMVSHDPLLVASLCSRIVMLTLGKVTGEVGTGSASQIAKMLERGRI